LEYGWWEYRKMGNGKVAEDSLSCMALAAAEWFGSSGIRANKLQQAH